MPSLIVSVGLLSSKIASLLIDENVKSFMFSKFTFT
ncbi:uncharacterized protein METZ01_LOCUS212612 [marine metagenome]|uniref:Uncharacterized protein n=1 Tax=marine metagenome TaxID=408172 RepID=A0A382F9J2_9ZZZZ